LKGNFLKGKNYAMNFIAENFKGKKFKREIFLGKIHWEKN